MQRREIILLLLILGIAGFLRLWKIGVIPVGVTHDELGYIYNSYSVSQTGKNVFGEFLPFLTWINKGGWPFLPVPIYISVPFFWLFGISSAAGRLPAAILGIADVFLIYVLVKQIFGKSSLALISSLFLAVSPWHIHFSRTAYDTNFSLFFYLLGIVLFIYEIKNRKLPILSLFSFLLAIFSYRGMNPVFPALVAILIWYGATSLKMKKKQLIGFLIGVGIIAAFLLIVIRSNEKTYAPEALFDRDEIENEVNNKIREASGPLFVRRIFVNKITNVIDKLRENYIKGYSPEFLFLYTEPSGIYSIWSRGRIYFFDLFLIILGTAYLFRMRHKEALLLSWMLLAGGLPGMFGGAPYSSRNFFMSSILPVFSAGGVLFFLNTLSSKKIIKAFLILVFGAIFTYLIGGYLFDYYGRYAHQGAEYWAKSIRDLSTFIKNEKKSYKKITVGNTSFGDFMQYMFYLGVDPRKTQNAWKMRKSIQDGQYIFVYENVYFAPGCVSVRGYGSYEVVINRFGCKGNKMPTKVIRDFYKNPLWDIYIIGIDTKGS